MILLSETFMLVLRIWYKFSARMGTNFVWKEEKNFRILSKSTYFAEMHTGCNNIYILLPFNFLFVSNFFLFVSNQTILK